MSYTLTAVPTGIERMSKTELAAIVTNHSHFVWSAYPPITWRKDELVNAVRELLGR